MRQCVSLQGSVNSASTVPLSKVAQVLELRRTSSVDSCKAQQQQQQLSPPPHPSQHRRQPPSSYLNSDRLVVDSSTQVNFLCKPPPCSRSESPESRPLERAVEARTGSEDGLGSMVRCLHFAHTFIANRKYKICKMIHMCNPST